MVLTGCAGSRPHDEGRAPRRVLPRRQLEPLPRLGRAPRPGRLLSSRVSGRHPTITRGSRGHNFGPNWTGTEEFVEMEAFRRRATAVRPREWSRASRWRSDGGNRDTKEATREDSHPCLTCRGTWKARLGALWLAI